MTTTLTERKCRVCGCTQNDCSECIAKTGEPCHWVEDDLCSACVPVPEAEAPQPVKDDVMDYNERILKQKLNNNDMNFFKQLNDMVPGADISIVLKEKNGKYTMSLLPNVGTRTTLQPLLVTGTPDELDEKFFELIRLPLQETAATLKNADEHKKSVQEQVKDKEVSKASQPKEKKEAAKKPAKKEAKKEEPKTAEPDLFATA